MFKWPWSKNQERSLPLYRELPNGRRVIVGDLARGVYPGLLYQHRHSAAIKRFSGTVSSFREYLASWR